MNIEPDTNDDYTIELTAKAAAQIDASHALKRHFRVCGTRVTSDEQSWLAFLDAGSLPVRRQIVSAMGIPQREATARRVRAAFTARPSRTSNPPAITRTELQARHPQACVVHGWRLSGVGPARFGWWAQHPTGACTFLGRTLAECTAAAA